MNKELEYLLDLSHAQHTIALAALGFGDPFIITLHVVAYTN